MCESLLILVVCYLIAEQEVHGVYQSLAYYSKTDSAAGRPCSKNTIERKVQITKFIRRVHNGDEMWDKNSGNRLPNRKRVRLCDTFITEDVVNSALDLKSVQSADMAEDEKYLAFYSAKHIPSSEEKYCLGVFWMTSDGTGKLYVAEEISGVYSRPSTVTQLNDGTFSGPYNKQTKKIKLSDNQQLYKIIKVGKVSDDVDEILRSSP